MERRLVVVVVVVFVVVIVFVLVLDLVVDVVVAIVVIVVVVVLTVAFGVVAVVERADRAEARASGRGMAVDLYARRAEGVEDKYVRTRAEAEEELTVMPVALALQTEAVANITIRVKESTPVELSNQDPVSVEDDLYFFF